MKTTPARFLPLASAVLTLLASPGLHAQTTVIVSPDPTATPMLVQPVAGGTPMEVVPVQQPVAPVTVAPVAPVAPVTTVQTTTVETAPVTLPVPGQHVADILITVSRGSVQAYFGRAARGEKVEIGNVKLNIKLPSRATVTKLANRDDDSEGAHHITPDNPWHVVAPFDGSGRYVFNVSDWDNDAVVTACVVKIDGVVIFSGHGSEDDFNGWAQKHYAEGVRKTGSREIAFVVGSEH